LKEGMRRDPNRPKGPKAFITGDGLGFGAATAKSLAQAGADIVIADRSIDKFTASATLLCRFRRSTRLGGALVRVAFSTTAFR